jgi:hypothetical protein
MSIQTLSKIARPRPAAYAGFPVGYRVTMPGRKYILERRTMRVVRASRIGNPFIEQSCTVITLRTSLVFLTKGVTPSRKSARRTEYFDMTNKITTPRDTKKQAKVTHPGMMGDGTEEQNLGERGNPAARIRKKEVAAAFGRKRPSKWLSY